MDETEKFSDKETFVENFKYRTKQFTIRSLKLFQALPDTDEARIIGKQFLRAASSTGANYRAACRARSKAEFHAKLSITVEEADESLFWLEIMSETEIMPAKRLEPLMNEVLEIVKVLSTAKERTHEAIQSFYHLLIQN
ncbi:MAG: four helix bundle protein [Siphonobacter sp.]